MIQIAPSQKIPGGSCWSFMQSLINLYPFNNILCNSRMSSCASFQLILMVVKGKRAMLSGWLSDVGHPSYCGDFEIFSALALGW